MACTPWVYELGLVQNMDQYSESGLKDESGHSETLTWVVARILKLTTLEAEV